MDRVGALDRFPSDSENRRPEGDKNRGSRRGLWVRRWAGSVGRKESGSGSQKYRKDKTDKTVID